MEPDIGRIKELIRDIPDFPTPGIGFKDITPLIGDGPAFAACIDALAAPYADQHIDKVVGVEARGFIVASPVAYRLGAGVVPVRKKGKLPWHVEAESYSLEYRDDTLEIHTDAVAPGDHVLIVDDVLATGGTATAARRLVERLGATAVGFACIIELEFLGGRGKLEGLPLVALVNYE
jgi:adenine phosphoribosyltransferase